MESMVSDIPAEDGKIVKLFLQCMVPRKSKWSDHPNSYIMSRGCHDIEKGKVIRLKRTLCVGYMPKLGDFLNESPHHHSRTVIPTIILLIFSRICFS